MIASLLIFDWDIFKYLNVFSLSNLMVGVMGMDSQRKHKRELSLKIRIKSNSANKHTAFRYFLVRQLQAIEQKKLVAQFRSKLTNKQQQVLGY